ncbi:MAG: glycosyltransferase family 2 protein [Candidatus Sumerlaeia bacterium]
MSLPTIAIVTPSLNQGRYLEQTIRSVVEQDYPALRYWVQDGGSTDGSLDIIKKYEPQLAGWTSGRDEGHADAVNRGFSRIEGEVMAFINSDDYYLPGALRAAGEAFAADPELDMIYGDALYVDPDDRPLVIDVLPAYDWEDLKRICIVPQQACFWRRRAWEAAGGLGRALWFSFDYEFFLKVAEKGKVRHVPRLMAAYRHHMQAKTSHSRGRWAEDDRKLRERYLGRPEWDFGDWLRLKWLTTRQIAAIGMRSLRGERFPTLVPARWQRVARRRMERLIADRGEKN